MGAFVSTQECRRKFNVTVECDFKLNSTKEENFVGEYPYGAVPADPDVAGVGIIFMFVAVTSLAWLIGFIDIFWRAIKLCRKRPAPTVEEKRQKLDRSCGAFDLSRLFETIILSFSDQQVFTGGAYALSLRYWKACTITAYHYNIVAKMLLLTCATHLISVAIVRNYWRYPLVAIVRTMVTAGVFAVTGLLLGNQNATHNIPFPTSVPALTGDQSSPIMMLALCFMGQDNPFLKTFTDSFRDGDSAEQALIYARPGNKIEGWNMYLFILMCYGLSTIAAAGQAVARSLKSRQIFNKVPGMKGSILSSERGALLRRVSKVAFGFYLLACLVVSGVTIGMQVGQIYRMRTWVRRSGWLENEDGRSDEDSWSSFGQLVPMFLGLLTIFTIFETVCQMCSRGSRRKMIGGLDDTETGGRPRPPYQPVPTAPSAPAVHHMSSTYSLPPLHQSQSKNTLRSSSRPVASHRNSAASAAPLLGSPSSGPNSPPYSANRHHSDTSLYSSYYAMNADGSFFPQQGSRGSIPRRPVGR